MTPEEKKQLSEVIEEGIIHGFWKPIALTLLIVLSIIMIGAIVVMYQSYVYDDCVKSGECPQIVGARPSELQYKHKLDCVVFVGNITIQREVYVFGAEDYIDANAKLEQIRPFITNVNKTLTVFGDKLEGNTSDWKLIGIKCG